MLTDLPSELLTWIFSSLDSLDAASKLSRTNRRLHELWMSQKDSLTSRILPTQVPAYDSALLLAVGETHHALLPPNEVCVKDLAPLVLRNAAMCKRVFALYKEEGWLQESWYVEPHGLEVWSEVYYDCLLLACAHDHPALRKTARRRIKALPLEDLERYSTFLLWFLEDCWDDEIGRYHDLIKPGSEPDPLHARAHATDRWAFAMVTVDLYENLDVVDTQSIGRNGQWSAYHVPYEPAWL